MTADDGSAVSGRPACACANARTGICRHLASWLLAPVWPSGSSRSGGRVFTARKEAPLSSPFRSGWPSVRRRSPPRCRLLPPSWSERHLDQFFDPDAGRLARRATAISGSTAIASPCPSRWRLGVVHRHRRQASASVVGRDLRQRARGRADAWEWLVRVVRAEAVG
jgi:hypothetical protein